MLIFFGRFSRIKNKVYGDHFKWKEEVEGMPVHNLYPSSVTFITVILKTIEEVPHITLGCLRQFLYIFTDLLCNIPSKVMPSSPLPLHSPTFPSSARSRSLATLWVQVWTHEGDTIPCKLAHHARGEGSQSSSLSFKDNTWETVAIYFLIGVDRTFYTLPDRESHLLSQTNTHSLSGKIQNCSCRQKWTHWWLKCSLCFCFQWGPEFLADSLLELK